MRDRPRLRHLTPHERDVLAEFLVARLEQFLRQRGLLTEKGKD